ncbi:MAG: leucine-rich repeat domain-containing protein, partial [Coriobacteriales bacterium]
TSISIPDSITSIDSFAFSDCTSLTSITLSDNVTFIGHHSFSSCTSLTSIILPDKVVAIIFEAFRGCSGLTSIILPESLVSIGDRAFEDCSGLTRVYYKGTKAEWDEISVDSGNEALQSATIYYYSETKPPLNGDGTAYDGNYWRYAADGVTPVIWKKQTAA